MPERILFPEWRAQQETTKYPFAMPASLTNGTQTILQGTFLDASLYPIGGAAGIYLMSVAITSSQVTLTFGDPVNGPIAAGSFSVIDPPDCLSLADLYGRPAGILVSESLRLSVFGAWGVGTYKFKPAQTELDASVCVPTPEAGVRGFLLPDGTLMTGDVWLAGNAGVVLSRENVTTPAGDLTPAEQLAVIRVDVVGDPLFVRRLCTPPSLFQTPNFVKTITFQDSRQQIKCKPNANGGIKMTVNNNLAVDTVLRIRSTANGTVIEAVGAPTQGD